jgi:hypothetical protein
MDAKRDEFNKHIIFIAFVTHSFIYQLKFKHESLDNNNKEVKRSKEREQEELGRENAHDYIRKNERIHYVDDDD